MNIRQAILKAADSIELEASLWNFDSLTVPSCRTPACALGWIGFHLGVSSGEHINVVANLLGAPSHRSWYALVRGGGRDNLFSNWVNDRSGVAALLRAYADEEYPEAQIPESVLHIFKPTELIGEPQ